jgi:flagellar biosynthetic protein FliR
MPASAEAWTGAGLAFLLTLARVASLFLPLSLPGGRHAGAAPKAFLVLALTAALWTRVPPVEFDASLGGGWAFLWLLLPEIFLGTLAGVAVSFVVESVTWAMQMVGLNAGFQFASTFDPSSQADSTVLPALGQLIGLVLFFAAGLDGALVRALAASIETVPPGVATVSLGPALIVARAGSLVAQSALRLALPLLALLVLIDLALTLVSRVHAQLQLLTVAFPAKMLLSLAALAVLLPAWTSSFGRQAAAATELLRAVTGN